MKYSPCLIVLPCIIFSMEYVVDAASWKCKAVDKGDIGESYSLAVTSDGKPRIAYEYRIDTDSNIRYAYPDGKSWQLQGIGPGGSPSLVLSPEARPRIGYGAGKLMYVFNDGDGWMSEEANPNPYGGDTGISLKLGSSGRGCMSYVYSANGTLQYSFQDESGWHLINVDDPAGQPTSWWTSMVLDGGGAPHIVYGEGQQLYGKHNLRHAYWDGSVWLHETVDADGDAGRYDSTLVIDSLGKLQIAYWALGNTLDLRYAWRDGSGWQKETIAAGVTASEGGDVSLAVDQSGRPHVACQGQPTGSDPWRNLTYGSKGDSGWSTETVDNCTGSGVSLALDAANTPHIVYYGTCGLMYATPGRGLFVNSETPRIDVTYIDFETWIYWSFAGITGRVDAYLAVKIPGGGIFFIDSQRGIHARPFPIVRGVTIGSDVAGKFNLFYSFLPTKGSYTFMTVCVPTGKTVMNPANWLGEGVDQDIMTVDYETPWWW